MNDSWQQIFKTVFEVAGFFSHAITITLGLAALWGLVFKRKELSLALRVFTTTFLNQRVNRLKETLGHLVSLSYDTKDDRSEIHALLGQVSGQVKSLSEEYPKLTDVYEKLQGFIENKRGFSESKKREIVYEIHGHLDTASFNQTTKALRTKK